MEMSVVQYLRGIPDPRTSTDHRAHAANVKEANQILRAKAAQDLDTAQFSVQLRALVSEFGGVGEKGLDIPMCVGSDGRLEKGHCSPMELALYLVQMWVPEERRAELASRISAIIPGISGTGVPPFGEPEIKFLDQLVSCLSGDRKKLWPCRVIDARPLRDLEDGDALGMLRDKLALEVCEADGGQIGKKIIEAMDERIRKFKKVTRSGVQSTKEGDLKHYDLETGEAYYDYEKSHSVGMGAASFKQSVLRLAQNVFNRLIIKTVQELGFKAGAGFLRDAPANTEEKMHFIDGEGVLTSTFPEEKQRRLIDNYQYFLWLYHQSEYDYFAHGSTTISFDRKEVRARLDETIELVELFGKSRKDVRQARANQIPTS